jgi:hypothetical protein
VVVVLGTGRAVARRVMVVVLGTGRAVIGRVVMMPGIGMIVARRVMPRTRMILARRMVIVFGTVIRGTVARTRRVMFTTSTTGMTDIYAISVTFNEVGTVFVDTRIPMAEFFY